MNAAKRKTAQRRADDRNRKAIIELLWDRRNENNIRCGVLTQSKLAALLGLSQRQVTRAMNGARIQKLCAIKHPGYTVQMEPRDDGYLYFIYNTMTPGSYANEVRRLERGDPILERAVAAMDVAIPINDTAEYLRKALEANGIQRAYLVKALAEVVAA